MTTDKFCFYLQNKLIQTGQTGGQQYGDTSPFSIPWFVDTGPVAQMTLMSIDKMSGYKMGFDQKCC